MKMKRSTYFKIGKNLFFQSSEINNCDSMLLSCHLTNSARCRASVFWNGIIKASTTNSANVQYHLTPRKSAGNKTWQTFDNLNNQNLFSDMLNYRRHLILNFSPSSHFSFLHQSRWYSVQQPNFREKPVNSDSESFTELYLVNNIRYFRILCRFSRYSFLMFLVGSPLCILSSFLNLFPIEILQGIFGGLTFYMLIFTGQSFLFTSRIIAKIMISENHEKVKISRLTLFGNRKDLFVNPSDIVKFPFYGAQLMSKNMLNFRFHNRSERLIFLPSQGGVDTNHEILEMLLCSDSKEST